MNKEELLKDLLVSSLIAKGNMEKTLDPKEKEYYRGYHEAIETTIKKIKSELVD